MSSEVVSLSQAPPINVAEELRLMRDAINDTRYLKARQHYQNIQKFAAEIRKEGLESNDDLDRITKAFVEDPIILMINRCGEIDQALNEFNMKEGDGWTLGLDMFGYRTHYIIEDDGNVNVRIEGMQDRLPLFEQMAVIRELPLYCEWMPFCDKSSLIKEIEYHDLISYLNVWSPLGISRDMVVRGYGSDCLLEFGKVVIVAKSVDSYPGANIPPLDRGFFRTHHRSELKHLNVVFDILSPTSAKVKTLRHCFSLGFS
jgi:hypothetical protein